MSKNSKVNKTILIVVAAVLVVIIGFAYVGVSIWRAAWNPVQWIKPGTALEQPDESKKSTWGGVIDDVGNEMNAEATYAMPAAFAFYSNTSDDLAQQLNLAAPAVTVTCSHNFEFNNVLVDWSVEYPSGASASDVVTVAPTEDGSLTASVSCIGQFDKPLTLKATLRGNAEKTATCKIDYVKRIQSFKEIIVNGGDFDEVGGVYISPEFSIGTTVGTLKSTKLIYTLTDNFKSTMEKYLKFDIKFKSYIANDLTFIQKPSGAFDSEGEIFEYDMFIQDFDKYDDAHKNAIYYAWSTAYLNRSDKKYNGNVEITLTVEISYNGKVIGNFTETDYNSTGNTISGDAYGYGISPDLTLNGNFAL